MAIFEELLNTVPRIPGVHWRTHTIVGVRSGGTGRGRTKEGILQNRPLGAKLPWNFHNMLWVLMLWQRALFLLPHVSVLTSCKCS